MRVDVPILAVIGRKKSGKTTVIEGLVSELTSRQFKVASVKHISHKGFSMDSGGRDTWRHMTAGANPVIAVSDAESVVRLKDGIGRFSLDSVLKLIDENEVDVLILEGFSSFVLGDEKVAKITCLRNLEEYEEFSGKALGEVLAFCSFQPLGGEILNIKDGLAVVVERAVKFVKRRQRISEILSQLAGLDCRKCGRATCEELAEDIFEGQASVNDCLPLKLKPKLRATIMVGDSEVPVQPFVSEILRKTILAMVSTLKGVTINGQEKVHIVISK